MNEEWKTAKLQIFYIFGLFPEKRASDFVETKTNRTYYEQSHEYSELNKLSYQNRINIMEKY